MRMSGWTTSGSVGRLFQMTAADIGVDCSCSTYRQFHGVGRVQMTSTGCCRDQDAVVCQVRQGKTVEALDHGKLELYSLPDGEPVEDAQYRCDVVKLSSAGHNTRC